jgi:hypothetical protein
MHPNSTSQTNEFTTSQTNEFKIHNSLLIR